MKLKNMQDVRILLDDWVADLDYIMREQEKIDALILLLETKENCLQEARDSLELGLALANGLIEDKRVEDQDLFNTLEGIESDYLFHMETIAIVERDFIQAEN